jgi:protein SCO1/2
MRVIIFSAVVLLVAGCGAANKQSQTEQPQFPPTTRASATFAGSAVVGRPPAPDIALRDQDGRTVRLSDQRGKYVLVTFLYTHCPDVCPLIASSLNSALAGIGPARQDVRVLAVSVDPKGDTRAAVRAYARRMHLLPQFRYLTGTRSQLVPVWRSYNVIAVASGPEVVDHVAYTVLVDRTGRRRLMYDAQVKAHQVVHDLRVLMKKNPTA